MQRKNQIEELNGHKTTFSQPYLITIIQLFHLSTILLFILKWRWHLSEEFKISALTPTPDG